MNERTETYVKYRKEVPSLPARGHDSIFTTASECPRGRIKVHFSNLQYCNKGSTQRKGNLISWPQALALDVITMIGIIPIGVDDLHVGTNPKGAPDYIEGIQEEECY
jgi:hypothetical protein